MKLSVLKKNNLIGDISFLTISKMITSVLGFITSLLLARYMSLFEYGTYSSMLLVINLVSSVAMLGLPNCVGYFLGRSGQKIERQKFLSVYYSINTVLSSLIGLLMIGLIVPMELYFKNDSISQYWYFLLFFPWSSIINASLEHVLVAYSKTKLLLIFRALESIFVLLNLSIAISLKLNIHFYIVVYTLIYIVFAIFVYIVVLKVAGKLTFCFDRKWIKAILKFSLPIGLATAVGTFNIEIDKMMIGAFMSTSDLAIYTNSAKELPITIVSSALTGVLLPRMSCAIKMNKECLALSLWKKIALVSFAIYAIVMFGCFVYANEVILILYSDKYLAGVSIFRVYCLILLFRFTYFGILLNAFGKTKLIFISSILSLTVNVLLNFPLFFIFGPIGCAISTFIAIGSMSIFQLIFSCKIANVRFSNILPWGKMLKILLLNFGLAVFFYRIKTISGLESYIGEIWESIILGVSWSTIYFLLIVRFKKFFLITEKHEEIEMV